MVYANTLFYIKDLIICRFWWLGVYILWSSSLSLGAHFLNFPSRLIVKLRLSSTCSHVPDRMSAVLSDYCLVQHTVSRNKDYKYLLLRVL